MLLLLSFCLLGKFACFLSSDDSFLQNHLCSNHSFKNPIIVSNSLDLDQARRIVGPDLVPNCLQTLSADDTSSQRVNKIREDL